MITDKGRDTVTHGPRTQQEPDLGGIPAKIVYFDEGRKAGVEG